MKALHWRLVEGPRYRQLLLTTALLLSDSYCILHQPLSPPIFFHLPWIVHFRLKSTIERFIIWKYSLPHCLIVNILFLTEWNALIVYLILGSNNEPFRTSPLYGLQTMPKVSILSICQQHVFVRALSFLSLGKSWGATIASASYSW